MSSAYAKKSLRWFVWPKRSKGETVRFGDLVDVSVGVNDGISDYLRERYTRKLHRHLSEVRKEQIDLNPFFYVR